jgi:hypothetical protein
MGRMIVMVVALVVAAASSACTAADPARTPCEICRVVVGYGGPTEPGCTSDGADAEAFPPVLSDGGVDPCFANGCFPSCGGYDGGYDRAFSTTCLPGAPLATPICVTTTAHDGG